MSTRDDRHPGPIQEQLREMGRWLTEFADRPEVLDELTAALELGSIETFGDVFNKGIPFEPPKPLCNPYVHVIVSILGRPEIVEVCRWSATGMEVRPGELEAAATNLNTQGFTFTAEQLKRLFVLLKIIVCGPEVRRQTKVIDAEKFVNGICPWGTF